jgi:hypothetical protein
MPSCAPFREGANDGRDQQDGQSQVENQDPPAVAQLAFPVAEDRGHRGLVACGLEGCGLWKAMANRFQLLAAFVARVRLAGRECSNSLSADAHKESVACMSALWVSASAPRQRDALAEERGIATDLQGGQSSLALAPPDARPLRGDRCQTRKR